MEICDSYKKKYPKNILYKKIYKDYSIYLVKVDTKNNCNKRVIIQIIDDPVEDRFTVIICQGRLGNEINIKYKHYSFSELDEAIKLFEEEFTKHTGHYFVGLEYQYEHKKNYYKVLLHNNNNFQSSSIITTLYDDLKFKVGNSEIYEFINVITDLSLIHNTIKKYSINIDPMLINNSEIEKGFSILKDIYNNINSINYDFETKSNDFYSHIPIKTSDLRKQIINNVDIITELSDKLNKLLNLGFTLLKNAPNYDIPLTIIKSDENIYKQISSYVYSNLSPYHDNHFELVNIFKFCSNNRVLEKDYDNKMLLWHGSKLPNIYSILTTDLKIAPIGIPKNGAMFGNGIYFADSISKSAQYCLIETYKYGVIFLYTVSLGNILYKVAAQNITDIPNEEHQSVQGLGTMVPSSEETYLHDPSVVIPIGKLVRRPDGKPLILLHNEYIVYDPKQILLEYIIYIK